MSASNQGVVNAVREPLPAALERLNIQYSGPLHVQLGASENALRRPATWSVPPTWKRASGGILTLDEAPSVAGLGLELSNLPELDYGGWGLVEVEVLGRLERLRLTLRGAGRLQFRGQVAELAVELSGAGTVLLSGEARRLTLRTSGAGEVQAQHFRCAELDLDAGGSGRCQVWVEQRLRLRPTGCREVAYSGWPQIEVVGAKAARLVNVN